VLGATPTFSLLLGHMATAIGPNLSVDEVIWRDGEISGFQKVKPQRLRIDPTVSEQILIKTQHEPLGIVPPYAKFICHVPDPYDAKPWYSTLTRALAGMFAIKRLNLKDWATFSEVFGMPVRVARYESTTTATAKTETRNALRDMGSRAWMLLPADVQYEIKELARGTEPYSALMAYLDRQIDIGYLGQTLTTDVTGSGGLGGAGAAAVHEGVLRSISEADVTAEEMTLRTTLFPWMLEFAFPAIWGDMPIPRFKRKFRPTETVAEWAGIIETASQRIGLQVPTAWAHETLKIPELAPGDSPIARIEPAAVPGAPVY
jgi:phage gp29-like protein